MAMEKRVRFRSWWLPYALVLPQVVVTAVFFFIEWWLIVRTQAWRRTARR